MYLVFHTAKVQDMSFLRRPDPFALAPSDECPKLHVEGESVTDRIYLLL